jgi:hypothetical protein
MKFSLKRLSNTKDHKVLRSILTYLELLLALLRTRGAADNKTRTLFLSTKRIEEFTLLIDVLIDEVNQANISLKSRISLNLEKPEVFYKTPDIIYALKVYLSGERGANTISVVSVSDE